jgi:dihydroorotase
VVNMANVQSKMLNIGVSLDDVIRMSTSNPAKELRHPELGTIKPGSIADIAVYEVQKGNYTYNDVGGGKVDGTLKLQPFMTVYGGTILFDPAGLSKPYWQNIPKENAYWKPPIQPY